MGITHPEISTKGPKEAQGIGMKVWGLGLSKGLGGCMCFHVISLGRYFLFSCLWLFCFCWGGFPHIPWHDKTIMPAKVFLRSYKGSTTDPSIVDPGLPRMAKAKISSSEEFPKKGPGLAKRNLQ